MSVTKTIGAEILVSHNSPDCYGGVATITEVRPNNFTAVCKCGWTFHGNHEHGYRAPTENERSRAWPKVWTGSTLPESAPRATVTTLAESVSRSGRLILEHCSAGYRLGINCWHWHAREYWARVFVDRDGTRHSKPFETEADGRAAYDLGVIRERKRDLEHRKYLPGCIRADIDRATDSLEATRKYGKRGKRGGLIGEDAKKERNLIASIGRLTAELPEADADAARATAELDATTWPE